MSSQVERAIVPSQAQTVEGLLQTAIASARMRGLRRRPSAERIVPCKCGEGLTRYSGRLVLCPYCLGSRVVVVGTSAYYVQQKGNSK